MTLFIGSKDGLWRLAALAMRVSLGLISIAIVSRALGLALVDDPVVIPIATLMILVLALPARYRIRYFPFIAIVAIKFYIYAALVDPLGVIDAKRYYFEVMLAYRESFDFVGVFQRFLEFRPIIVDAVARTYELVSYLFDSRDPYVLVFANHLALFFAAAIFADLLGRQWNLSTRARMFVFLAVYLSPIVSYQASFLLKEAFVLLLLMVALDVLFLYRERRAIIWLLLFLGLGVIGTMMRPYFFLLIPAYVVSLHRRSVPLRVVISAIVALNIVLIAYLIRRYGGISALDYSRELLLTFGAVTSSPNFFRAHNWNEYPLQTAEALFISVSFLFVLSWAVFGSKGELSGHCRNIVFGLILFSVVLGAVSIGNRERVAFLRRDVVGLVGEDVSRKKVPIIPLQYQMMVLLFGLQRIHPRSNMVPLVDRGT